jgi:hypothetical protein
MRPNLSIEHLAVTLAALGTVTACTRAEPAATRPDTPMSSAAATPPPPQPVHEEEKETTKDEHKKSEGMATATATASARPIAEPRRKVAPDSKGGTGQASCGAGTCTADPKKK